MLFLGNITKSLVRKQYISTQNGQTPAQEKSNFTHNKIAITSARYLLGDKNGLLWINQSSF